MAFSKDEEIAFRGYIEVNEYFNPSDDLSDTISRIEEIDRIKDNYTVHKMSDKEALKDTKIFYDEFLEVHNVIFYNTHKLGKFELVKLKKVDPFKLPIRTVPYDGDIFEGSVIEHLVPDLAPIATFRGIMLVHPYSEHTPISYTHELMHTQIDSVAGSVEEYFDAEVMSIFIELVFTFYCSKDERLLNLEDSRRIYEMAVCLESMRDYFEDKKNNDVKDTDLLIDGDRKGLVETVYEGSEPNVLQSVRATILENSKYLVSDLKAYDLFITFYFGNSMIKREMLNNVQRVLDGEITVKDYLGIYNVNSESMQDEKRLLKYFNR